jgi:5-methylcytosine-specific restriction endonuclease McrA
VAQHTRNCDTCGKTYTYHRSTSKYCGTDCRYRAYQATHHRLRLPDNLRYSVLVRDNFTCQYCGASPRRGDKVTLDADHVVPVAKGGKQLDSTNLITACNRCNSGKSDT